MPAIAPPLSPLPLLLLSLLSSAESVGLCVAVDEWSVSESLALSLVSAVDESLVVSGVGEVSAADDGSVDSAVVSSVGDVVSVGSPGDESPGVVSAALVDDWSGGGVVVDGSFGVDDGSSGEGVDVGSAGVVSVGGVPPSLLPSVGVPPPPSDGVGSAGAVDSAAGTPGFALSTMLLPIPPGRSCPPATEAVAATTTAEISSTRWTRILPV
ncbi:hypothetical protein GGI11_007273, partial [Coemansia sp. RSA 2049]